MRKKKTLERYFYVVRGERATGLTGFMGEFDTVRKYSAMGQRCERVEKKCCEARFG